MYLYMHVCICVCVYLRNTFPGDAYTNTSQAPVSMIIDNPINPNIQRSDGFRGVSREKY
jgi:hypothetical protein